MEIIQLETGVMAVFTYIVYCPLKKEAIVIDPGGDEDRIVQLIDDMALRLIYIVNTHGHADHTCGNLRVKELTGAKILMHEKDDMLFNSPIGQRRAMEMGFTPSPPADIRLKDMDIIRFGTAKLMVLHTPGHSPGSICLYGDGHLFTGDTLFVGAAGRTDLPGASLDQLIQSIKDKILPLPDDTIIMPGHDYGDQPTSTIAREKATNPYITDFILY